MTSIKTPSRYLPPFYVTVLIFCLALTTVLVIGMRTWETEKIQQELVASTDARTQLLDKVLHQVTGDVGALAHFIQASGIHAEKFSAFSRAELTDNPLVTLFAWVPRVQDRARNDFVLDAIADGLDGYDILDPTNNASARKKTEYFPLRLIEPYTAQKSMLGWDLSAERRRNDALETARDTGRTTITEPIPLALGGVGIVVVAPVYAGGVTPDSILLRRERLLGFSFAALSGESLSKYATAGTTEDTLLEIHDRNGTLLHTDSGFHQNSKMPMLSRTIQAGNRQWQLDFVAGPSLHNSRTHQASWGALAMGLLLSSAFSFIAWQNRQRQQQISEEVAVRTQALRMAESRFSTLFENATEGVLILNAESGSVQDANPALCKMLGYTSAEILKLTEADLRPAQHAADLHTPPLADAHTVTNSIKEITFLRANGTLFIADVNCSTMQIDNIPIVAAMITDASMRLEAQQLLEAGVRQRTRELSMSEARSRAIQKTMLAGVVHIDNRGTILTTNHAVSNLFGYEEDELIGQNVRMLMPEHHASAHDGYLQQYAQTRAAHIIGNRRELQGRHKNGYLFPIELSVSEMMDDEGNTFIGLIRDISKEKENLNALNLQRHQIQTINDALSRFITSEDSNAFFESMLPNILELTGSQFGFIGEILHDENSNPYLKIFSLTNIAWDDVSQKRYAENKQQGIEFRNLDTLFGHVIRTCEIVISNDPANDTRSGGTPDGHPPLHSFLGIPVILGKQFIGMVGLANRPNGYDKSVVDLLTPVLATCAQLIDAVSKERERKHILAMLKQQKTQLAKQASEEHILAELLRLALMALPLDEFIDITLRVLITKISWLQSVAKGAILLTEHTHGNTMRLISEYGLKETPPLLVPASNDPNTLEDVAANPARPLVPDVNDLTNSYRIPLLMHDVVLGEIVLYLDPDHHKSSQELNFLEQVAEIVAMGVNRRQLNQALMESKIQAEAADVAKSHFLANMSHEIRTPINALLGFAYLCLNTKLDPQQTDYVSKMRMSAESLLGIINDILDFSKIEAGKLVMEITPFNLDDVLGTVNALFSAKSREKNIEFVVTARPDAPHWLLGDPTRLNQILVNLIGNAIKFTQQGEISLIVEPLNVSDASAVLRFIVRDTGLGMTPEQQAILFTPFTQADSSTTRKFGGTGLGLVICRQLVERMGGDISIDSQLGSGSTFSFTARFGIAQQDSPELSQPAKDRKQALIVDDNENMRELLTRILNTFGYVTQAVHSGEAALKRLKENNQFDIILTDWHLVEMDGVALARRIRECGMATPIILITGKNMNEAQTQSQAGDIQAFLSKPISRSTLYDTLANLLGASRPPIKTIPKDTVPILDGKLILLVDDNDFNRQVASELIALTGARIDMAEDGLQAVQAVAIKSYDLVLMDLQMPVMDGYAATRVIRDTQPNLPIIALTAHAMIEERQRVLDVGMDDILTKPILPEALYAGLLHWLTKNASTQTNIAPPHLAHAEVQTAEASQEEESTTSSEITLDIAAGMISANGNQTFYARMLKMFQDSPSTNIALLKTLIADGDITTATRQVHSLKGIAGSIGAKPLQKAAASLETALKHESGETESLVSAAERQLIETLNAIAQQEIH